MEFFQSRASARNLITALVVAVVLALLSKFVMAEIFREAAGFAPFDLQPKLSRNMLAIELGTVAKGELAGFYLPFAVVDFIFALAAAWAYALLWAWLFAKAPLRVFAFLANGGILFAPFVAIFFDLAAKIGFTRLLRGLEGAAYSSAVEFSVAAHAGKYAFLDLRNYLTVAFVATALMSVAMSRVSKGRPPSINPS